MAGAQRRLTTIVAADIAGFSRLVAADEEGTLAAQRGHRDELIQPLLDEYHGRIANTAGDSFLFEFPSAVEAVRCALAVQEGMVVRNQDAASDRKILYRIGINVGDVLADGDDLLGDGVNVAARLESLADPGGVCISRTTRDQVRDRMNIALEDLGEVEVKNIARPVRVFKVLTLTATEPVTDAPRMTPVSGRTSVAVLPFNNLGGGEEANSFCDGLSEDIITELSRQANFDVIARNTMFTYKGGAAHVRDVGLELGSRYVLEGSVRFAGQRVRVTAQLVESDTENHVWAERYDRDQDDVFKLQDELSRRIAISTTMQIAEAERKRGAQTDETDATANDLLQKGLSIWYRFGRDSNMRARKIYEQALALEPDNFKVFVSLTWTYINEYRYGFGDDPDAAPAKAIEYADKAVKLGAKAYVTHQILALATACTGDMEKALIHIRRALELNQNDTDSMIFQADFLSGLGRCDEAITLIEDTMALNEKYPEWYYVNYSEALFEAGRYEDALRERSKYITTSDGGNQSELALFYFVLGRKDEAAEYVARVLKLDPSFKARYYANRYRFPNDARRREIRQILVESGIPD